MNALKQLIKASPLGPLAERIYNAISPTNANVSSKNSQYDRQTVEVISKSLKNDSNCLDIGAHQGSILQEIIARAPQGNHFAFEPLPHLAQKLKENFPNVRVFPLALSDRAGRSTFQYVKNKPAYSGLRKRIYDNPDPIIEEIEVEIARLDELIPNNFQVDFIKLDIEGGEYHTLQGGVETIRRCLPIIVFEAGLKSTGQYGVSPDELYRLITETIGYHLSTMERWLKGEPAFESELFQSNWYREKPDYYFIAYPKI
jgi:FkbM family methyltransferase